MTDVDILLKAAREEDAAEWLRVGRYALADALEEAGDWRALEVRRPVRGLDRLGVRVPEGQKLLTAELLNRGRSWRNPTVSIHSGRDITWSGMIVRERLDVPLKPREVWAPLQVTVREDWGEINGMFVFERQLPPTKADGL